MPCFGPLLRKSPPTGARPNGLATYFAAPVKIPSRSFGWWCPILGRGVERFWRRRESRLEPLGDSVQLLGRFGVGALRKIVRPTAATAVRIGLGTVARRFRMKWTRHRCHAASPTISPVAFLSQS